MTVLFCDVVDSMALSASVDGETWRALMDRFYDLISEGVERVGGTVDKFTGDGAMALFGAPISFEDHAQRACHAALWIRGRLEEYGDHVRREYGIKLSTRLGLNSGEVIVGGVGGAHDHDYTAIGNTVGLAARLESLAEPRRPYLSEDTAALVEGWFELEDVGPLVVKGVERPVRAYALLGTAGARTRLEASTLRGFTPLVGRSRELAVLEEALVRTRDGGHVVGLVAEPGTGKSRLCHEFAESCRAREIPVTLGAGVAHGSDVPLLPVLEMLREFFGIEDTEDPRSAREKVAGRLLLLDEAFREALPLLFDFLAIPDPGQTVPNIDPEGRQRLLFAVLRRLVHARAQAGSAVVLVEDLHWLDPGSEAFLENLVDSLPGSRTLLVVNFRPEYRADWLHRSSYEQISLRPLGSKEARELAGELLGDDPSLDGLAEMIAEHTAGNPFFAEELVRSLVGDGSLAGTRGDYRLTRSVDSLRTPATVEALLAARVDRLGSEEKSALQLAAVLGRELAEPVLRRMTGLPESELRQVLGQLCRAELLYETEDYPEVGYAFTHPLTQEVAYRSQLRDQRMRAHASAADALEVDHPHRLDELAGLIAGHREQAGDAESAARWHARAATWAGRTHPAEALRHWQRVRALTADTGDSEEARGVALGACLWTLQFGWRLGMDDPEISEIYKQAGDLARSGGAAAMTAVKAAYALNRGMTGHVLEALALSAEARALADELDSLELRVSTGYPYWLHLAGRPREALEELDHALDLTAGRWDIGRDTVGLSVPIWCAFYRAPVLIELGRLDEAERALEEALVLAREHNEIETLGWTETSFGYLSYFRGVSNEVSLAHARAGAAIADRIGSSFSRILANAWLTLAYLSAEEWVEATAAAGRARDIIRQTGTGVSYLGYVFAMLAEARIELAEPDAAEDAARSGIREAVKLRLKTPESWCRLLLGTALLSHGATRGDEARSELDAALELASVSNAVMLLPRGHAALARLSELEADDAGQRRHAEEADRLFAAQGAGPTRPFRLGAGRRQAIRDRAVRRTQAP